MNTLTMTSCQAPIAEPLCAAVADYLAARLNIPMRLIADIPWQLREHHFDIGQIDIAWICGTPYVWKADQAVARLELLAAPVMAPPRYQQQPVYFSEVVVHRASRFQHFADLRGASWAYNEPRSHSGYHVVRYHLALLGETTGFFGRVIESGAHQTSLQYIVDRQVDATAIDSTVLELISAQQPEVCNHLRRIAILGPSPMPPWVIGTHVPRELRERVRTLLLQMHHNTEGQELLARHQLDHFAAVTDQTYDVIRQMLVLSEGVKLSGEPEGIRGG